MTPRTVAHLTRATGAVVLASLALMSAPPAAATDVDRRARQEQPLDLHGPMSDFWARVRRDWERQLEGLKHGKTQTAIWVGMIWGGPGDLPIQDLVDDLQEREARHWLRAQITKDRWSDVAGRDLSRMKALHHNVILVGTPEENDLVGRALAATPVRVARGSVTIGGRRLEGDGLLVLAIAPNPIDPRYYALVITGSSASALLEARGAVYGDSDYIVYRGRKVLDRGLFAWTDGRPSQGSPLSTHPFTEHFNWATWASAYYRLHHDPSRLDRKAAEALGRRLDAELEESAVFYGIPRDAIPTIDCYLYVSVDEKANQTGDARLAHIDPASLDLHVVFDAGAGGIDALEPALSAGALLRRARGLWGPETAAELPGLAAALSLACRDQFEGIPLAQWEQRSSRDAGYLPMDVLMARRPKDLAEGDVALLDAAAFLRDLVLREGAEKVARFYRAARRAGFRDSFKDIFGRSITQAEREWLGRVRPPGQRLQPAPARDGLAVERAAAQVDLSDALAAVRRRDDTSAERMLRAMPPSTASRALLARVLFRTGRFDEAIRAAREALSLTGGSPQDRAWAHLTLGRAEAMSGHLVAASTELRDEEIRKGPAQVRTIADYWLENLGQPLNQRAAGEILIQQAEVDLMDYKWEEAEKKLQEVLAADPQNWSAHAALGKVYKAKFQYWFDFALLDRELFPGESTADPYMFLFLSDKGNEELRLSQGLPGGEQERPPPLGGAEQPDADPAVARFMAGRDHYRSGDLGPARSEFEAALALKPRAKALEAYCRLYLGRIEALTGHPDRARPRFEEVIAMAASAHLTDLAKEEIDRLERAAPPP